jgi:formate-dependent nitrite reductase membrane component NrfD
VGSAERLLPVFSSFIVWYLFLAGVGSGAFIVAAFSIFAPSASLTSSHQAPSSRFAPSGFAGQAASAAFPGVVYTHVRWLRSTTGLVIATASMAVAALSLLFDFAEPLKTWRVVLTPFSSLASFGANVVPVFTLLTFLLMVVLLFRWRLPRWLLILAFAFGSLLACAVMLYAGLLLAGMVSIDVWHTWLVPLLFVISSLSCGLAAVLFFETIFLGVQKRGFELRWRLLFALGLLELAALGVFLVERGLFSSTARDSILMLLGGEQAIFFLGGVVAVGIVLPLMSHLVFRWVPLEALVLVSAACVLAGGFFLRYCLVEIGRFTPIFPMT